MKALIRVTRLTTYASVVEMPQDEFNALKSALDGPRPDCRTASRTLNDMIDTNDWQSDELEDVEDFEPFIEPPVGGVV